MRWQCAYVHPHPQIQKQVEASAALLAKEKADQARSIEIALNDTARINADINATRAAWNATQAQLIITAALVRDLQNAENNKCGGDGISGFLKSLNCDLATFTSTAMNVLLVVIVIFVIWHLGKCLIGAASNRSKTSKGYFGVDNHA